MKNIITQFNKAFTLAEVLITLVIIGVVAALVISPLINTYVESSTVAKVKKDMSIIGQAVKLAEIQNGPISGWDFEDVYSAQSAVQFWNYLKPHLSVIKDCGASQNCYQSDGVYLMNGTKWDVNFNTDSRYYKIILSDGSVMWFRTSITGKCQDSDAQVDNTCAMFWHDVNGDKKPNMFGKDVFRYAYTVGGIYPDGNNDCYIGGRGMGCSSYIIRHNNMKYLH